VQHSSLVVQETSHATTSETASLTQHHILALADTLHAHTTDGVVLVTHDVIQIAEALHYHLADQIELSIPVCLVIAECLHNQFPDAPALAYQYALWGITRDKNKVPLSGVTVYLFRTDTLAFIGSDISNGEGRYRLETGDNYSNHFIVSFYGSSPRKAGISIDTLVGK